MRYSDLGHKKPPQANGSRGSQLIIGQITQGQVNKPRESSSERQQMVQFVVQSPNKHPMMRTVQSGYMTNSSHTAHSQAIKARSPPKTTATTTATVASPTRESFLETDKKNLGILLMNKRNFQKQKAPPTTVTQIPSGQLEQPRFDSSGIVRNSLEELYREINQLRTQVSMLQAREKKMQENQQKIAEKEKSIMQQLAKQKIIFEQYQKKIKELHSITEGYQQKQRQLANVIKLKSSQVDKLQTQSNRSKIELAQQKVKINILQSQLRNNALQNQQNAANILTMLKIEVQVPQGADLMRVAMKKIAEYSGYYHTMHKILKEQQSRILNLESQREGIEKTCSEMGEGYKKKEDELARAKDKITELVTTFYGQITKLNSESTFMKNKLLKVEIQKQQIGNIMLNEKNQLESQLKNSERLLETLKKDKDQLIIKYATIEQSYFNLQKQIILIKNSLKPNECSCSSIRKILNQIQTEPSNNRLQQMLSTIFQTL